MGRYTTVGLINAWIRAVFGILIGVSIYFLLNSIFLGVMAMAILFFLPIGNERLEQRINSGWFAFVMYLLLLFAFYDGGVLGLGIDLGAGTASTVSTGIIAGVLGVLVLALFLYSLFGHAKRSWMKRTFVPSSNRGKNIAATITIIIFIIFILFSAPWNWSFSAIIFVTIWFVAILSGMLGGIEAKQTVGIILLIISFFIYTFGVGSDQVGAAAFGDTWWPSVKDFGKQTLEPIVDSFKNMFKSFKEAIDMLTCPTCAARDIVDSIYANPASGGKVGSFGLEFEELTVPDGKLNLGRPFSVTMSLKNQGAKDAENVNLDLLVSKTDYEKGGWILEDDDKKAFEDSKKLGDLPVEDANQFVVVGELTCDGLKKTGIAESSTLKKIAEGVEGATDTVKDFDYSKSIGSYETKNYIVPVKGVANYNYKMDSQLSVEFISTKERERLVKEKKLERKKVKGTMTTSPLAVSLSMDMDQPVIEGTRFYVGLGVKLQEKSAASGPVKIKVRFPKGWVKSLTKVTGAKCEKEMKNCGKTADITVEGGWNSVNDENTMKAFYSHIVSENKDAFVGFGKELAIYKKVIEDGKETDVIELIVYKITEDAYQIFFDFPTHVTALNGKPTETFVMTAESEFSAIKWREVSAKFEFGGFCCKGISGACLKNQECNAESDEAPGNCVATSQPVSDIVKFGEIGYCKGMTEQNRNVAVCGYGYGECENNYCIEKDPSDNINLKCRPLDVNGVTVKVCCKDVDSNEADCKTEFEKLKGEKLKAQSTPS